MRKSSSGFGRLMAAWGPVASRAAPVPPPVAPETGSGSAWPSTGDSGLEGSDALPAHRTTVLVACHASGRAAASALALRLDPLRAYRFCTVAPASAASFDRVLRAQSPRLLLIDVELAQALGAAALQEVRRTSPNTDWLLLWHESTPRGFELAVACRARGCIEWHSSGEQYLHALRTVVGGALWFSHRAMESLYVSLLAGGSAAEDRSAPEALPLSPGAARAAARRR
jgi:DNA-binding NarL/FixJ family response regulator